MPGPSAFTGSSMTYKVQDVRVPVTPADVERATKLIANDLEATLGWSRQEAEEFVRVEAEAQSDPELWWMWDEPPGDQLEAYTFRVAEEVQQTLHDTRTDTSWPRCPVHPNHPMWLDENDVPLLWRCPATTTAVAPLGQLPPR